MCSIIGRLATGSIGLGVFDVSGRSRVPSPPAMITAFMSAALLARRAGHGVPPEHRWPPRNSDSASPGRPVTHATTSATSATGESLAARRKAGRENISANVPALPAHFTSNRCMPNTVSITSVAPTTISREDGDAEPRGHRAVDQNRHHRTR